MLWFTDITEHPTREGKLYLCAVKDACSKRIGGYSINDRVTSALAVDVLRNAITLRNPDAIVHSGRGSQCRSHAHQRDHREVQLRGSMGSIGTCADYAAMESVFSLLQQTCSTDDAGPPAPSSASRSCRGPRRPTTADHDKKLSAGSIPRRVRDTPLTRRSHGPTHPPETGQPKPGQSP
ncbi:hypothetical protein PSD17_37920 [Pseudonocardia sp. D17]|nr:hypothetical protein PSD17_37920 [Pseudonocardia sp. D17]